MAQEFSDDDYQIISKFNQTFAAFSLVGCLFIMVCYWRYADLRNFAFTLVFWMSVTDLIFSIGNIMGDVNGTSYPATDLCKFQGVLRSFGNLSSLIWAVSIAFTLHLCYLQQRIQFSPATADSILPYFHLACWIPTVVLTFLPFSTDSYVDSGGWCSLSPTWIWIQFFGPLVIGVVYCCWVYYAIYKKLISNPQTSESELVSRVKYYPAVLIVSKFFAILDRFLRLGDVYWVPLACLHVAFSASQGWMNAVVYGMTDRVRKKILADIPCYSGPSRNPSVHLEASLAEHDTTHHRTSVSSKASEVEFNPAPNTEHEQPVEEPVAADENAEYQE